MAEQFERLLLQKTESLTPEELQKQQKQQQRIAKLQQQLKKVKQEKLEFLLQKQEPTPQDLQWIREELQTQELQNKVEQLELLQQKNKPLLRQAQGHDATLNAQLETLDTQIQKAKQELTLLQQQEPQPTEQQWRLWIRQEIEAQDTFETLQKQREQLLYPDPFDAQMMKKLIEQDDQLKRIQDMKELLLHKSETLTPQEQEWIKETFERLLIPREKQRIIRKLQAYIHELEAQKNKLEVQWSKTFDQREELYAESLHLSSQSQLSVLDAQWSKLYAESLNLSAQLSEADAKWRKLYAQRIMFAQSQRDYGIATKIDRLSMKMDRLSARIEELSVQKTELDYQRRKLYPQKLYLQLSELRDAQRKDLTAQRQDLIDQIQEAKNFRKSLIEVVFKGWGGMTIQQQQKLIALLQHKRILELQQQKLENIVDQTLQNLKRMDSLLQKEELLKPQVTPQAILLMEQQAVLKQITEQSIPKIIDKIATDGIAKNIPPEIWDKKMQLVELVEKTHTDVRTLILEEVSQTLTEQSPALAAAAPTARSLPQRTPDPTAGPTLVSPFYGVRVEVSVEEEMDQLFATQQPISEILSQSFYFIADDWKALQIPEGIDMRGLLNKSYEQLNTQELYILEDIIAQKRKVLEQGHVPSLRHLERLNISKDEALKHLLAFNQAIIHRRIQLFLSDHVVLKNGKVDSQTLQMEQLQKEVDDLVEDLDSWSQKKLSEADQYISQERDAIELSQTHFSQLQERWEIDGKIDLETFKNWAKQKYALEYQAQAFSERARMLKRQGVSQQALLPRKNPVVTSEPDLEAEVISDTQAVLPKLPGGSIEDALSRFYIQPEHIRKYIRDYGGDIDRLASMDMQHDLIGHPDRLHAVRTIISGRMKDIRQGDVAIIAPEDEKVLTHLRVLRNTLTNRLIEGLKASLLLYFSGDTDFLHIILDHPRLLDIGPSLIGVSKRLTIYFAMEDFYYLGEQHLRELSGVIDQRLTSIEATDASPPLYSPLYDERLSLYMLQEAIAERRALLLGQDPPPKSPFSLPQFYITAEDIYKVHGWHHGLKEEIVAFIYKDLDELNQTELERVQQVVSQKHAAVYEQSTLELDSSVYYEVALRRLEALKTAIAAKRKALNDGGHFSIKDQLVSQRIVEWDEAEGAKWSTKEVQTSDHLTRKLRQLEGVELESSGYETAQRELKQLEVEFNKQLTYKDIQITYKDVQELHLEQRPDLWETYPALTLLSKSGELQELQELELVKTKSSSGASVAAASPHQDVLSIPKQNTGHIEAIIHKTYEQQPELMGVIQNQATSIIHPSGDEAVQIYKGPGHTVEYTAQDVLKRRENIFLVGQHQEDGRNIWVEVDTGSKASGGKPSKLAVTESPKAK